MNQVENVLLLAMSTLPRNPAINTYCAEHEETSLHFKGISQLEAHTKYVISLLKENDEPLSRIVILSTCETREQTPDLWHGETAISFYEKRVREFCKRKESSFTDDWGLEDKDTNLKEHVLAKEVSEPEILIIESENEIWFWDAVKAIKGTSANCDIHLYMDMQGGDRNAIFAVNSIIELLKNQNVTVCGRYANDFRPQKTTHQIREVSGEYRTYDLITAMEVFKNYGWGGELKKYFNNVVKDSKEFKLLKAIEKASKSISLCDVDDFDDAIRAIEELHGKFENISSDSSKATQLDVVYQDIYQDYSSIFQAKYRYVEQIQWCLRKNFVQQALTIFEAKMPYEYIHSGMVYYFEEGEDKDEFLQKCKTIYYKLEPRERYKMIDLNHYLVKYRSENGSGKKNNIDWRYGCNKNEVIRSLNQYKKLCKQRNDTNHASSRQFQEGGFAAYMRENDEGFKKMTDKATHQPANEIKQFLANWIQLADSVPKEIKDKAVDLS